MASTADNDEPTDYCAVYTAELPWAPDREPGGFTAECRTHGCVTPNLMGFASRGDALRWMAARGHGNPNELRRARSTFELCPNCQGRGATVNPAIDGNGLSAEDMDELGPDFREDYLSGVYDIACPCCKGRRVVTPAELAAFDDREMDRRVMLAESGGGY